VVSASTVSALQAAGYVIECQIEHSCRHKFPMLLAALLTSDANHQVGKLRTIPTGLNPSDVPRRIQFGGHSGNRLAGLSESRFGLRQIARKGKFGGIQKTHASSGAPHSRHHYRCGAQG
jgi:hypothetical protein